MSESAANALSANQGRVLGQKINDIPNVAVVNNLTSTSTVNALSANMGRELMVKVDNLETGTICE